MEVQLYTYDLSQGLARSMSAALLGVQLDALYHTSIVLENVEYVSLAFCIIIFSNLSFLTFLGIRWRHPDG